MQTADPTVFEAIKRGYPEFDQSNPEDIIDFFNNLDPDSVTGHISNIKGIYFEQLVADNLQEAGLDAVLFEQINHPNADILIDSNFWLGAADFQVKATDSASYIASTLEENPDIPIIVTSEVASDFDGNSMIIDSGISNEDLTEAVTGSVLSGDASDLSDPGIGDALSDNISDTLADAVTDSIFPFSPFWLLGLPF